MALSRQHNSSLLDLGPPPPENPLTYDLMPSLTARGALGNQEILNRSGLTPQHRPPEVSTTSPPPSTDPRAQLFKDAYIQSRFYHSTPGESAPSLLKHGLQRSMGKDKGLDAKEGRARSDDVNFIGKDRTTARFYKAQAGKDAETLRVFLNAEEQAKVLDDPGSDDLAAFKVGWDIPPERVLAGKFSESSGKKDMAPIYQAISSFLPEDLRELSTDELQTIHTEVIKGGMLKHVAGQPNGIGDWSKKPTQFPYGEPDYDSE